MGTTISVDDDVDPGGRLTRLLRHPGAWLVLGSVAVGVVVAVRSRAPMIDDVGITARYAERIAEGAGWTYNDGDRTNGASAPLYTVLLAIAHQLGFDVLVAARVIGVAAVAASTGLVAHVGTRVAGPVAGAVGAASLLFWPYFQQWGTSGMESALAAALGMAVIAALLHRREVLAGVLLGLALLNKLDAGMLALAVAAAVLVVERRPPWRIAAISTVPIGLWTVGSWLYFGAPLPNSFTQKADGSVVNPAWEHEPTWLVDVLNVYGHLLLVPAALASLLLVPALRRDRPGAATVAVVAVVWPALHGLAFSLLDLGDAYLWYAVAMCPPLALAAGIAVGGALRGLAPTHRTAVAAALAGLLVVAALAFPARNPLRATVRTVRSGHVTNGYDGLELARQEAGRRLGRLVEPGDVVSTCFGWIAYHAASATIRETCPLNTREPVGEPRWYVEVDTGTEQVPGPPGTVLVDSVVSEVGEGARVDVYRAGPP